MFFFYDNHDLQALETSGDLSPSIAFCHLVSFLLFPILPQGQTFNNLLKLFQRFHFPYSFSIEAITIRQIASTWKVPLSCQSELCGKLTTLFFLLLPMLCPLWTETWTFMQHCKSLDFVHALRRLPNIDGQPPSQFKRWHICLQEVGG